MNLAKHSTFFNYLFNFINFFILFYSSISFCFSFVISLLSKKIYFSGDTAFGPMFSKIGEKLGPFDLSIISIGAYKPRGMMQASHCTPEEAVEITSMLTSKNIIGMHWGTIRLSAEDPWEPPIKFKKAAQLKGYHENQVWQLSIGETKSLI